MDFRIHTAFSGNAAELAALAIECGRAFALPVDPDKTSERLVRYYVSAGVLDRPDRVGRDAAYGYRHLLQLLTARRMGHAGTPLSTIAEHNVSATTKALEDGLAVPLPTAAQLLVSRFKTRRAVPPMASPATSALSTAEPSPALRMRAAPPPPMALPDVLDEVRQLKGQWMDEIAFLKDVRRDLDALPALHAHIDQRFDALAAQQQSLLDAIDDLRRLVKASPGSPARRLTSRHRRRPP